MVKSLVLGGCGFIGFHLGRRLAGDPRHEVVLVDNLSRGKLDADLEKLLGLFPNVRFLQADLTQPESFRWFDDSYDHVFLLAGVIGVHNTIGDPARVLRTNSLVILNTLDWLSRAGCGSLVFSSTSEVYAGGVFTGAVTVPTDETVPVTILDPRQPRFSYAISKLLGEAAVAHYSNSCGFPAIVMRYHNIYGPRMGLDHVVPELMQRVYTREDPLRVYGTEDSRAFCYVEDAVTATLALASNPPAPCEIVHVGNDREEIRIGALLEKIRALADYSPEIEVLMASDGSVPRRCPDVSKLRRLTGYEPQWPLDAGLAETWSWYQLFFESQRQRVRIGEVT